MKSQYDNLITGHKSPMLSVIMPVYNPNKYFSQCLESILDQTFKDFELIAIDDCSTDGSDYVLNQYATRDDRIIPLKNDDNIGAAQTRNRGLHLANGKYVVFLDADDFFKENYFSDAISALEKTNADASVCHIALLDMQTGKELFEKDRLIKNKVNPGDTFNTRSFHGIFQIFSSAPYNKIVRRDFLLSKKIEFQNLKNSNDVFFSQMVLSMADSIVYLPEHYIHYRYNWSGQITAKRGKNPYCIVDACKAVKKQLLFSGKWEDCRKSFNEYAVDNFILSIDASGTPEQTLHKFRNEIFPELKLNNLSKTDFISHQGYGRYMLFYANNALLNKRFDIICCIGKTALKGAPLSAFWILGHYVKMAISH